MALNVNNASTSAFLNQQPIKMLIGGRWVESASGKTFDSINPSSGEVLAKVAEGDAEDINRAWYRQCCGYRRHRCQGASLPRPWRRRLWGAAPCRDNRSSTRSRHRAARWVSAKPRAGNDRPCVQDPRTPDIAALPSAD